MSIVFEEIKLSVECCSGTVSRRVVYEYVRSGK